MSITSVQSQLTPLTYASINLGAIGHNFKEVCLLADKQADHDRVDRVDIIPVVKSQAYGHGLIPVARVLVENGAQWLAVSNPQEAVKLREAGFLDQHILLLESTLASQADLIVKYNLTPTLCTIELAEALEKLGAVNDKKVNIHVKIDTGMSRFGVPIDDALDFIKVLRKYRHLEIDGIYTHFPMADSDSEFTQSQIGMIKDLFDQLKAEGFYIPRVHAANSMGLIGYRNFLFNLARTGIMIYGSYPRADFRNRLDLKPAMTIHTQIVFIKAVKKGEGISYGFSYIAKEDMTIAVLPIGYADGYFRHMSNKAFVLINGKRCPVVGRVTMDQIIVDISTIHNPIIGMDVVVMGQQGDDQITADELASWAETISYEIMCSLGSRLERIYEYEERNSNE